MVREKYEVRLSAEQRDQLEHLIRAGKSTAGVVTRARILLKTDQGWPAPQVAQALDVVDGTVYRIKRRFAADGMDGALQDRPQSHRYRKLDDRGGGPLDCTGLQPSTGRPRPLDSAAAGGQGGTIGAGAVAVP